MSKQAKDTDIPSTPAPEPAPWLIFRGHTGQHRDFPQLGAHVIMRLRGDPLVLDPGLNPAPADWSAWAKIPAVRALVDDGSLTEVSASLDGVIGPRLRELAEQTASLVALEHLLSLEQVKPTTGPYGHARDQDLIAIIERRIQIATMRRTVDLSGIAVGAV